MGACMVEIGTMLENARDFYVMFAVAVVLGPLVLLLLSRNSVMSRFWGIVAALGLGTGLLITLVRWGGSAFWHSYPG